MIFEYLTKSAFTLSLPSGSLATLKRARTLMLMNTEFHGESADTQPLTREAGISEQRLANVLSATAAPLSFEQPADDKNQIAIGDILKQSTFRPADEEFAQSEMAAHIRKSLERLTPLQREVICLRFGLEEDGPFTLRQIGRRINLSKEWVRQIVNAAIKKLRESIEIHSLLTYIDRAA
jgi:RNA polymerase nonessential primary-like sigma factor